jgi:uncharacterized protein YjbI with pentapeptide repeats
VSNTRLRDADLRGANLSSADLIWAKDWSGQQLAQAKSLVDAYMPGKVFTEEDWEDFKKLYSTARRDMTYLCIENDHF